MKRKFYMLVLAGVAIASLMIACAKTNTTPKSGDHLPDNSQTMQNENNADGEAPIALTSEMIEIEKGFSAVRFAGDDGLEDFLSAGGASSDAEVVKFLSSHLLADVDIVGSLFGCSTLATRNAEGEALFGRNFDWKNCDAMVVSSKPEAGYASLSTVNMDFISQSGGAIGEVLKWNDVRTIAALYAPLDGMNEAGFTVAVNMIEDSAAIEQNTDKPDITTTTAIRLLLNKAGNVDEALALLEQYDIAT